MDARCEIHFDQREQDDKYIRSRQIEKDIIKGLRDVLREMDEPEYGRLEYCEGQLMEDLQRRFNDWQFQDEETKVGLISGECGEAFSRLLGSGIMLDMPQIIPLPKKTDKYGVHCTKLPKNGLVRIEVVTTVGKDPDSLRGCKFTFATDLKTLDDRQGVVEAEINKARNEIRAKRKTNRL